MRTDVSRFAGEVNPPELLVSPLIDRGVGTVQGRYRYDYGTLEALRSALAPELTESDHINFIDLEEERTPDIARLKEQFEDATGGIHPGHPTVKYRQVDTDARLEDTMGISMEAVTARLVRFYQLTKFRPRASLATDPSKEAEEGTWGGDANKFFARVRLPENPFMRSFLHELGHCSMGLVGFTRNTATTVDDLQWSMKTDWMISSGGLSYEVEGGECKGTILEEAVAEGLGSLVNRKLGLVKTRHNDQVQNLPDIVAPYLVGTGHSGSAPAAVALELIAQELGIPSDRYFRMFVDYANTGVHDMGARQEVAETIYRGTRGRLTMSQVEELPYPISREASLALLWAVEDALETPDHQRYADLFYQPSRSPVSSVVVGNSTLTS